MIDEITVPQTGSLIDERALASFDAIEKQVIAELPPITMPVTHRFVPGMYIREIFMPKGSLLTSKIHKTEHPYVISAGKCAVWAPDSGTVFLSAPFTGITKPGTKRIIFVHEDTIWTTFHITNKTNVSEIEDEIIFRRDNPLLSEEQRNTRCIKAE